MADKDAPKPEYKTKVRYQLLAKSYVNGEVVDVPEGEKVFVDYDGHPGSAFEPTDDEGRRRKNAYLTLKRTPSAEMERRRRMLTVGEGDPFNELVIPAAALPSVLGNLPPAPPPEPVAIPDDWKKLQAAPVGVLAFKISGEVPDTIAEAHKIIEAEIAKRMGSAPSSQDA